jgi:hypothetical protein
MESKLSTPVELHPVEVQPARPEGLDGGRLDLRQFLSTLQAVRDGDFSARLPGDWTGLGGKIADTFNEIVAANRRLAQELERVGKVVGKEGKTTQRVKLGPSGGAWREMEESIDALIDDLCGRWRSSRARSRPSPRGDLQQSVKGRRARAAARGRVPALGHDRQHDDQPARPCSRPR